MCALRSILSPNLREIQVDALVIEHRFPVLKDFAIVEHLQILMIFKTF